jgi:hypothetical protein
MARMWHGCGVAPTGDRTALLWSSSAVIASALGNAVWCSCFRIVLMSCGVWSADVHGRLSPSRVVVTQLVTRLGLDELAEHMAPEAATNFTLWCTAQTVVPRGPGFRSGECRVPCGGSN